MSDDETVPSFLEDIRVKFVEEKVCGFLRLQRQTWEKSAVNREFQKLLKDLFEKENIIFFFSSEKGSLVASKELQSPIVQKMTKMLEMMNSSYHPTIKTLTGNVSDALQEAQDIDLHLQPLCAQLSQLEKEGFPHFETVIPALFHTLFLIWTNCQPYQRPARIVVLLQELYCTDCYEDPEESLQMVKMAIKVFRCFRESYQTQRERLANHAKHAPWDFPSAMIFARFNQFLNRMLQLKDLFEIMLDSQRMEKLEFGGPKGKVYSEHAAQMYREFCNHCHVMKHSENSPLDCNSEVFENEYKDFKVKIVDFECRLASLLCLAFKDCSGLESAFKLLTVVGPFLERGQIRQIFSPNFLVLQQHFREELEKCKCLFKSQVNQVLSTGGVEMVKEYQMYMGMLSLLDQYEKDIYSKWCTDLEEACLINLNQPLVSRNTSCGLISVNFNPKLTEVLKDVKYIQTLSQINIPAAAVTVFDKRDMFTKYVSSLQLIVQWYNKLKQAVIEVELPLIRADLVSIDLQLTRAETDLTWQDQDCWSFIKTTKDMVHDLVCRVSRTKENCEAIQSMMKRWSKQAMFCRKDNKKGFLIQLEDRGDRVNKIYSLIKRDGDSIHKLVQENMVLFHADPASEAWQSYLEYVDEMVVEGLFIYISHSLQFFMDNMESRPNQAPLFEAQMMLNTSGMSFLPSLELGAGDGLYELIEGLVGDVFKTSVNINRVASHLSMESYQSVMDDMLDLLDLRQEIMERVENVLKTAINYQRKFDCYAHLWQDDRVEFLSQFLMYGHALTIEEIGACRADLLPESPPTVDNFKEQIDYYEDLYSKTSKLEDFRVFDAWFRVDIKFFKLSLLNTIKKWSWLFKKHLLTYVTNSLDELKEFVRTTIEGLVQPVVKGDHCGLVEVMSHLLAIRDRQTATDKIFEPLRDTVILLERYGVILPDQVYSQLESEKSIRDMEKEVAELQESTNLFDVTIPDYRDIKLCRREITVLKELWDIVVFVQDIQKLDKEARVWDVYSGLDLYVKNLLMSLQVVCQLQNLAIRERHWVQLIRITQMDFTVTDSTTLEDLLSLQLHFFEEEVCNIVDKAVKEIAIEKVVTEISQTWASMELSYDDHYQTSVPLLKCDEKLIETLEDHQGLMLDSVKTTNVIEATNKVELYEKLEDLQKRLALCEKALAEYLETKKLAFPRFYFISSADLLDMLSKGSRPKEVTVHLSKLFDSMSDLEFSRNEQLDNPKLAMGMYSKEREHVPFQTGCCCYGPVETWLTCLEECMKECVRGHLYEAMSVYEDRPREQWILDFPAQVALTGSQIWWSNDMELVFKRLEEGFESALKDYNKKQISQLNLLINMLLGELSSGDRQKIMTICTIDVHARDVVASLIAHKVTTSQAFQWLSQLRHCWNEQQHHCFVNICDAQFLYLYEYLGNTPRLVITPLTDRCYVTLTQSLHLTMSGAPAGPAGTGKTETTKDLGRAMGVMVYIFNCSEQMDYKSIGNIYNGLAQTGAWGCFDEFNRIPVDVLSVVAVQVKTIQDAIRSKKKRPCAMVVPDTELICEIMLIAEGFRGAKLLARKFITLYTLCKELLSLQDHYDWGLRAVKSVLVVAGALRRRDKTRPEDQVMQLVELMAVRHSVFVIGSAGTGKSQILRVLHKTHINLKRKPVWNDLNPKAVDRDELFGFIHPPTREWKDGLFSSLMREQANISHLGPKWIVLDGDIDPMWIESLNTVMDDNKVLTLVSNERVPLTSSMRLVFEISHLRTATPATVSRAGILYVNQQDLSWNPYVTSWIDQRERQTERAHLIILFEKYVPRCLEQMRNIFKTITPIPENSMVQTLCTLLDCLLTPENIPSDTPREVYETYFTFACIWAFGGALYQDQLYDYRVEFSQWWTKEMKTVKLPTQGTVFDYYLDPQTRRFLPWSDTVPPLEMETCRPLQAVLVHTAETVRLRYFVDLLLERKQPVMLVGNAGVGKTALVRNKLDYLPESYVTAKVPFNYYTTSLMLQVILERPLEKRAGRSYSPVGNKRLVYFIDDMNMPAVDSYGTVQPHALIRQHLDYGHCQILCGHLMQQPFSMLVQRSVASVVQAAITLHHKMVHSFLPTAIQFHYTFNLRDLSNIFQGILFAGPESVKDSTDLVLLWLHESCRVYSDRLVDVRDLQLFRKLQMETVHECFELSHQSYPGVSEGSWLVGVGGSGKQSLTRLAAYISSVEVFQITLSKGSSIQDLKMDLTGLFLKAGVKNQRVALLLTDAQIPNGRFLVIINDLLASGEIPELFSEEEIEGIVSDLRAEVVMCLSPVGSALRLRAHRFPTLIQCTTIDWFHPWTSEALQSVSQRFIQQIEGIEPAVQESISLFMAYVHTSVNQASEKYQRNEKRYNYTTPKSFLQQITLYMNLLEKSQAQLQHKMNRLDSGLQKLQTTATQVEDLKAKLAYQEAESTFKNQNIEALITKIGLQTERVSRKKEAADIEAQKVTVIKAEVLVKQKDCEKDLTKAEPSLAAATAALDTLNKVNLTELKAFPNPPAAVINVAAAVMVLLAPRGRVPKDRSWKAARAFMSKVDDFLQALVSCNKEHIHKSCLNVVKQEYLRNPEFHPDLVRTKSTAAAGLCAWTINIVKYYEDLDARLQNLTAHFERATAEKISCQAEVTCTNQTIELANRLVKGLESEKERWSRAVVKFKKQQKTLCGDVVLTSAFVSYMGYFTRQYRVELFSNKWIPLLQSQKVPIPLTDGLDPILMLTDDATVAAWHNQGLPNDRMSTENAAILTTSERWPLIIDPQQQGIKWIRNRLGSELRVVQLGQKGYLDVIEQALACGETVLIENLQENIDPVLEPLLCRNTIKRGRYIRIGGKECEYNSNFQLIIHTKLANPHFPPELQAQTTLINFTVTPVGLEEQLLGQVVSRERPDLEALKMELTTQQNHFKIELKRLEDDLLSRLSAAHGNFLGDISLVEQLENTKTTAAHIQYKVVEARENETKINEIREIYRPAAERASLLFFIVNDLSKINPMYQFSLKTFSSVLSKAIECAEWDEDVRTRVHTITEAITYSVFLYTSQGLFERDKLTFLSHTAFQRISVMEDFSGLDRDMESSPKRWRKIVESSCPEKERLPQDWKNKSSLQKLIILRALRPDRMTYTLRNFVEESMGTKYVEVPGLEFDKLYEDSGPSTPVFFILSPGVDPLKDVEKLGLKLGFSIDQGSLHNVSLGQGQEEVAERVLRNASKLGHWVILQNVHLVACWLSSLDALLETAAVDSHPKYRVFITGEPAPNPEQHVIPRGILENSIKITNEPPTGMNASLHAALNNFSQDMLDLCSREQEFNSTLFSLCFFHACVTERRKFGPQGNHNYPFSTGDLTISTNVLYNYLEANTKLEGELFLCPGFLAPPFMDYSGYHSYIDEHLPSESPTLYGLHPNAELECLTATSDNLLWTLLELQLHDSFRGERAVQSTEEKVKSVIEDILDKLPEEYNMAEMMTKATEQSPYMSVCLQECERMNLLLLEIRKSLNELDLGLKGDLTISSNMETLQAALFNDSVPDSWARLAYPSTKSLAQWFIDLMCSCHELDSWTQDFVLPAVVWLSGLFNPQPFLIAVLQSIARKNHWPLDKMTLTVDVTKKMKDDFGHPPREGAYIHGLFMEGARWDTQSGVISESVSRDLTPAMPVLYVRAVPVKQQELKNTYECPVYRTKQRGPTYVWTLHLRNKQPPAKLIVAAKVAADRHVENGGLILCIVLHSGNEEPVFL
ncbi:hypothetical protein PAMP_003257 [Pampus punctatissimus]